MEVSRSKLLFCLIFIFLIPLRSEGSKKVTVHLYYETLCPYCSNFIVNYLHKFFSNGLIDVVDLHLVPYGNARILPNGTIECQHGPYECFLNAVEACAIDIWPDVHDHFRYIYCVESLVIKHEYTEWETCFTKTSTDIQRLAECYNSGHGKKLELQYEAETSALQPPHKYVPWVVVDGHPLYEVLTFFVLLSLSFSSFQKVYLDLIN
ncbi:unnamed protein product [Victoria cruziana]